MRIGHTSVLAITALLLVLPCEGAGPGDGNDGVLNGPLKTGGHRAEHEGDKASLELAIRDLIEVHGDSYPQGPAFLARLETIENRKAKGFEQLKREALMANPLLTFDKVLLVRSRAGERFARNWESRVSLPPEFSRSQEGVAQPNYHDELVILSLRDGSVTPLYQPTGTFIGDVDLHCDGNRLLFTSHRDMKTLANAPGHGKGFAVFELRFDPVTGGLQGDPRIVSPDMGRDVDCFDACYLPDGRIIFASTASYQGVPCVGGGSYVANLYRMNSDGTGIQRLTFDQESDWHPAVMQNGRVMFTRWEYADLPHYFSRILMTMNPDGTNQKAFYGSNSYWPNSIFGARQVPGHPSMFIATVTGHHDVSKHGPLVLFDAARGRHEADGAVQVLTARGKPVAPIVEDGLSRHYRPHFTQPYPLSETQFLAIRDGALYLVDTFDNMLCLKPRDGGARYYEPIPLRASERPYVLPDRINPESKEATVLINDVHVGPGLRGVPRGTVKRLRIYRYEFAPRHAGGHYALGMEACWDARQVLGTAPVESDGSAFFTVPANTPFGIQPLDAQGRALQLMRSWTVAMPGERLSCIGCHESQNMTPMLKRCQAALRPPSKLEPFHGPARGFGFKREVQPVLDRYCVGCHDGSKQRNIPDLTAARAYAALHPFVRRNGPEGDAHLLTPLEFHAGTSELFQMLEKGHHNVQLDQEAWDRLTTWADLNAPLHATWSEARARPALLERRLELRARYANVDFNPETILTNQTMDTTFVMPRPLTNVVVAPEPPVVESVTGATNTLALGRDVAMTLVTIPAGSFSMGSNSETPVEQPVTRVTIDTPFQMGVTEVTLRQYRQFDPDHLNGVYDMHYKDQVHRGYYMNDMDFPVIRVSWHQAQAFCQWLSRKTGKTVALPSEAEWEWACRAGTTTPLSFGTLDSNFSVHANLADATIKQMAVRGVNPQPIQNPPASWDYELRDPRSNDGVLHLAEVGRYTPNAWGLCDMHGNAAEWTQSDYRPYPYVPTDGRNNGSLSKKTVRGGSWHDRPFRATSSYRLGFPPWQQVYHTGFRVVVR